MDAAGLAGQSFSSFLGKDCLLSSHANGDRVGRTRSQIVADFMNDEGMIAFTIQTSLLGAETYDEEMALNVLSIAADGSVPVFAITW